MDDTNTIWVSTAPRTGSMWVFNVTREIFRITGQQVEPEDMPRQDRDRISLAKQVAVHSTDPRKTWVLKVHLIMPPNFPRSKVITTHRDPRDVCVSFKEFMKASFERSLQAAKNMTGYADAYSSYAPDYLLSLPYEAIEAKPEQAVLQIAGFVGAKLEEQDARQVADKFSRNNVARLVEKTDADVKARLRDKVPVDPRDIVRLSATNFRARDRQTGFQTGHVSRRKTGDWAKVLTVSQQDILANEFGDWLQKYGYAP